MCKFCYELGENKEKSIIWSVRSCLADENIDSENGFPSDWDGKHRSVTSEQFSLTPYRHNDKVIMSVNYRMETDDGLIISPFSKAIEWSFCPFCGNSLNGSGKIPEHMHQFEILDEEYDLNEILKK